MLTDVSLRRLLRGGTLIGVLVLAACGRDASNTDLPPLQIAPPTRAYDATIRWTAYGVPHITAGDMGSLGYGFAYAVARDTICTFAREVLTVRGEQARFLGGDDGRRASDVFHHALIGADNLTRARHATTASVRELLLGYAAGYNRYLLDHGRGGLPAGCRDQAWVRPIDTDDLLRLALAAATRHGLGAARTAITAAAPPGAITDAGRVGAGNIRRYDADSGDSPRARYGSNAIALGSALTLGGHGLLLANPHDSWHGTARLHIAHLTVPGLLDAFGAAPITAPMLTIGFNKDVAWTQTASTAHSTTLYQLALVPGHPTQYRYGQEVRPITARTVDIDVLTDGKLRRERHIVYFTHFGPVLSDATHPWTADHVYALRDGNYDNNRASATALGIATARNVDDVLNVLRTMPGVAYANTVAADRHGRTLFAAQTTVANLDNATIQRCAVAGAAAVQPGEALVLRAQPDCEWRTEPGAAAPGLMPASRLPALLRDDFVVNANDSHWLVNPNARLEGFSPVVGSEGAAQSLRTRAVLDAVMAGAARKLGSEAMQALIDKQDNYGATLLLDDVLNICQRENHTAEMPDQRKVDVAAACTALARWDRRFTPDSRGAQIWNEFWPLAERINNVWRTPFDIKDPLRTPAGINTQSQSVRRAVLRVLARATVVLNHNRVALDARWGDVQFLQAADQRLPIPGGNSMSGMISIVDSELAQNGHAAPVAGNSWLQVVSWNQQNQVEAHGLLVYSQSDDPDSPHHADMTALYAKHAWLRLPFADAQIAAEPAVSTLRLQVATP